MACFGRFLMNRREDDDDEVIFINYYVVAQVFLAIPVVDAILHFPFIFIFFMIKSSC